MAQTLRLIKLTYVRQRPDKLTCSCFNNDSIILAEIPMYIGGILGTILVIALILFLVRRI
jgi:nitrate reductase gamma subunit